MGSSWRRGYLRYKSYFLNVVNYYKTRENIRVYLELLLSLATVSIFAFFALKPTLLTIAGLLREIETKNKIVTQLDLKIINLNLAQSLYDRERQRIRLLASSIPKDPDLDIFIRQVEGLSYNSNVTLSSLSIDRAFIVGHDNVGESKGVKDQDVLPEGSIGLAFSISSESDYLSLHNFLSNIENLRRPVKIDFLVFSPKEIEEGKVLSLSLQGRTPYLKETMDASEEIK